MIVDVSIEYGYVRFLWVYPKSSAELVEDWKLRRIPGSKDFDGATFEVCFNRLEEAESPLEDIVAEAPLRHLLLMSSQAAMHLHELEDSYLVVDNLRHFNPKLNKEPEEAMLPPPCLSDDEISAHKELEHKPEITDRVKIHATVCRACFDRVHGSPA